MRAVTVAISIATLAAVCVVLVGRGEPPVSFHPNPLLRSTDSKLVWPSNAIRTASAVQHGRVLAPAATHGVLSVVRTFAGSSSAETSGEPPDPAIAAGAGYVVQIVNSAVRIWTTGGIARATYALASFVSASSADVSDPRIVFDPPSGRWFASAVDVSHASVQVAVSGSSDPTGSWTVYSHSAGSCPDQPSLEVGRDLVVVGYGAFSSPCRADTPPTYLGGALFTYDKQQLLDGIEPQAADWGPRLDLSPIATPDVTPGPTVALALAAPPAIGGPVYLEIIRLEPKPTITRVTIRPLTQPPPAEQPETSRPIETNDFRILSAVVVGHTLWLAGNDGCVPRRDRWLRSCLRLVAVIGSRVALDVDIGAAGRNFFYPALALDQGNVVVFHGFSSSSDYPGLSAFTITAGNRRTREVTIAMGAGPYLSDRFGDYFGAATDQSGVTWVTGETTLPAPSTVGQGALPTANWATAVASVVVG